MRIIADSHPCVEDSKNSHENVVDGYGITKVRILFEGSCNQKYNTNHNIHTKLRKSKQQSTNYTIL